MFFLLSKLLDFILLPTVWLVGLLLAAWLARPDGRARQRWLGAALLVTLLGTSNALVNEALLAWEVPAVPLAAVAPADAAVLLTGVTIGDKSPHDRVYLSRGADRFTNALWLYRAGRVRRIIISGGSGAVLTTRGTEAGSLRTLLRLAGVPDAHILLDERSRNTHENALFTKELLAKNLDIKSLVLVTSAFHERRALGCFAKVGLHPQPFPADFRSTNRSWTPDYWLLPSANALSDWSTLLHELAGWVVYKVAGYC
ncbi:YdcF family protein [Hymenobacter sp. H14-R3]|uniref:YdcF family protein n=1 Tax=Hymenobacter sp. H14-R3 TaxID=3046308 RepID=UPI0024BBC9AE|nr:YdcF family protein [Hymenobacter sp. H14-R3]MDJ0367080.1 YdcF family protein [Hymenobacter sp. H14-R3]